MALAVFLGGDAGRLRRLDEKLQRGADLALEILVGHQGLIDHRAFERVLVDRDDGARGRLLRRRIPRRAAAHEQHQVRVLQIFVDAVAEMHRMVLGEIGVGRAALPDRRADQIGELDERVEGARIAARIVGEDHRVLRLGDEGGDALDIGGLGLGVRHRRDLAALGRARVQSAIMVSSGTFR